MSDCIFCKIVAGEIPSFKLYEDELLIAILDRFPNTPGHLLIIPKRHVENIYGLNEAEAAAIMPLAQKMADKINAELNPAGLNLLQNNGEAAGQEVFHFHLHLIPRYGRRGAEDGLPPRTPTDPTLEELAQMAERLRI